MKTIQYAIHLDNESRRRRILSVAKRPSWKKSGRHYMTCTNCRPDFVCEEHKKRLVENAKLWAGSDSQRILLALLAELEATKELAALRRKP